MFARRLWVVLTAVGMLIPSALAPAQTGQPKRPMTFEDMMKMRRLGDTDVSPNGKWLIYSVTDVDLAANTKTATLWIQPISSDNGPDKGNPEPRKLEGTGPGDGGARFSHDGKHLLYLSSKSGSQAVWVADFDDASGKAKRKSAPCRQQRGRQFRSRSRQRHLGSRRQIDRLHRRLSTQTAQPSRPAPRSAKSATQTATKRRPRARSKPASLNTCSTNTGTPLPATSAAISF